MKIDDVFSKLKNFDVSDPDISLPNYFGVQTANN